LTDLCHIKYNHAVNFHFSLTANCTDFTTKDEWRPNSPDSSPFDYHVWGAVLQAFHKLHSKPNTIPELRSALQQICNDLPQTTINKVTFANVWMHATVMVDILNIQYMNFILKYF